MIHIDPCAASATASPKLLTRWKTSTWNTSLLVGTPGDAPNGDSSPPLVTPNHNTVTIHALKIFDGTPHIPRLERRPTGTRHGPKAQGKKPCCAGGFASMDSSWIAPATSCR